MQWTLRARVPKLQARYDTLNLSFAKADYAQMNGIVPHTERIFHWRPDLTSFPEPVPNRLVCNAGVTYTKQQPRTTSPDITIITTS